MATILEKITQQVQNPSKVFLFKEGIFYKTYNQGVYIIYNYGYFTSNLNSNKIKSNEL